MSQKLIPLSLCHDKGYDLAQTINKSIRDAWKSGRHVYATITDPVAGNIRCRLVCIESKSSASLYSSEVVTTFKFQEKKDGRIYMRHNLVNSCTNLSMTAKPAVAQCLDNIPF